MSKILTAADLLQMGYVDDPLLLEDVSLCTVCSGTCQGSSCSVTQRETVLTEA